jgi:hypothetical protein
VLTAKAVPYPSRRELLTHDEVAATFSKVDVELSMTSSPRRNPNRNMTRHGMPEAPGGFVAMLEDMTANGGEERWRRMC